MKVHNKIWGVLLALTMTLTLLPMTATTAFADNLFVVGGGGGGGGGGAGGNGGRTDSFGHSTPLGAFGGNGNGTTGGGGGGGAGGYVGSDMGASISSAEPNSSNGPKSGDDGGAGGQPGISSVNNGGTETVAPTPGDTASSTNGGKGGDGASVSLSTTGGSFDNITVQGANGGDGGNPTGGSGTGGNGGNASLTLSGDTTVSGIVSVANGYGGMPNGGIGGTGGNATLTANNNLTVTGEVNVVNNHNSAAPGSGSASLEVGGNLQAGGFYVWTNNGGAEVTASVGGTLTAPTIGFIGEDAKVYIGTLDATDDTTLRLGDGTQAAASQGATGVYINTVNLGNGTLNIKEYTASTSSVSSAKVNALTLKGNGDLTYEVDSTPVIGSLTIDGGALNDTNFHLANDTNIASPNITLTNSATVDISGSQSIARNLIGTGALTKSGTGTLTLSGANTYTGGTTVNAGTLEFTSTPPAGAITVQSGAAVKNSTNANIVVNGNTVAPGVTYPDVTAPALTAGTVLRTSDAAATIGFTTDEAGTAYYLVQNSSDTAPTSEAVKAGTSLGSVTVGAANGLSVTLTAGAKDIYVVVEDAAGNISAPLKIEAAAYAAPQSLADAINSSSYPGLSASVSNNVVSVTGTYEGTTPVTLDTTGGVNIEWSAAYNGDNPLTVTGGGTLTVKNGASIMNNTGTAVYSDGDVVIEGGAISTNGGNAAAIYATGDVTIEDGTVMANGEGAWAIYAAGGVTIDGGAVYAEGENGTAIEAGNDISVIGGGVSATGVNGCAVVANGGGNVTLNGDCAITSAAPLSGNVTTTEGILIQGNTGMVYGDVTLTSDISVPSGATLTIPSSASLTVLGATLANNGTIIVAAGGTLTNNGTIENNGGTITGGVTGTAPVDDPTPDVASPTQNQSGGMTFVIDWNLSALTSLSIDGNPIKMTPSSGNVKRTLSGYPGYSGDIGEAVRGSTEITLYGDFLAAIPEGTHSLSAAYGSETASATFTTQTASPPSPGGSGGGCDAGFGAAGLGILALLHLAGATRKRT